MKVALMHWTLPPAVGGVETHLVNLADAYIEMGIKVVIVSGERLPSRGIFPNGVTFYFHDDLRRPLDRPKTPGSLGLLLSSLDVQIIHAHNILPLGAQLLPEFQVVKRTRATLLFHTSHSEWPGVEWPEDISI